MVELQQRYYRNHNIGWVTRLPHKKDGFIRAGRFKIASNMNFARTSRMKLKKDFLRRGEMMHGRMTMKRMHVRRFLRLRSRQMDGLGLPGIYQQVKEIILIVNSDTRMP
jgi:hypothetical protein